MFNEFATFVDKNTLKIGKQKVVAKNILIAVGSTPRSTTFSASNKIINSDQAFDIKKLPKKILILGGGYIAVEFASIFCGLGVDTTICVRGPNILRGFDQEISSHITEQMKKKDIRFLTNTFPEEVNYLKKKYLVTFSKKNVENFDMVMEAIGRVPNITNLNLDKIGVKINKNGAIVVDKYFRTSTKNIFAIGDVIDRVQLTPVAIAEAMFFVENLLKKGNKKFDYNNIPTAVFCDPNYSFIGLSETEARHKFDIKIYKSLFRPLKFSLSKIEEKVFIKLIVNKSNEKIIGLHYVGENAAEIIQGFSVAITNGLKKSQFDKTIGIHPTSAEEIVTLK